MSLLNKFRKHHSKQSLKEEIFEHICDLLNIKKSFGAYQEELGLDCYVYKGTNNEVSNKIIKEIKTCLTKFEKRIVVEEIVPSVNENPFLLSFIIKCKIQNNSHEFQISFHHQHKLFDREVELCR